MKDRRKGPRFDVVLQAYYETKEDFRDALIHSISEVGVYLTTDAGRIRGKCEVVWVNQIETEDYPKGMGVKFIELESQEREILEKYLNELEKA